MLKLKYDVLNRYTGDVQFTAEIDCDKGAARGEKLGLVVKWAIENGANLRGANLSEADLSEANLRGADLSDANLSEANLSEADLRWANLRGADLSEANLRGANLRGANLRWANLSDANLRWADLSDANLRWANLRWANLRGADLSEANLRGANLRGANLRGADLRGADLSEANLRGADLRDVKNSTYKICPEQGAFQAWKKLSGEHIALIEIPARAKRLTAIGSRKSRASLVKTLKIFDEDGKEVKEAKGKRDVTTVYKVGRLTKPDRYDDDPRVECSHGIHFFMTKQEAIDW